MNIQTDNRSRKDSIVVGICMLVFVLGMATGNALTMLVVSLVGFVGVFIVDRQGWGRTTWLAVMVSATIAAVTAVALTMLS